MKKYRCWLLEDCLNSFFSSISVFKKVKKYDLQIIPSLGDKISKHFPDDRINKKNMINFYRKFRECLKYYNELERRINQYQKDLQIRSKTEFEYIENERRNIESYLEELKNKKRELELDIDSLIKTKMSLVDDILKMKNFIKN